MDEKLLKTVIDAYGLSAVEFLVQEKGYRNQSHVVRLQDGHVANVILYKQEPGIVDRIRAANAVANFAARQGLPARETLDDRIARLTVRGHLRYAAVYHYLPGYTIPWEAYTMNHIKVVGMGLGKLHHALREAPSNNLPEVATQLLRLCARMKHYFSDDGVTSALARKLCIRINPRIFAAFVVLLRTTQKLPGRQPLHMDFVRSNLLFEQAQTKEHSENFQVGNVRLSGILDFEKTAIGSPLFDIARTHAFLLVDCKFKTEDKIQKYFLMSGYEKRGQENRTSTITLKDNAALLSQLVSLFLFYDFYKFLKHNPYESLEQNEHFTRTRDILIQRLFISQLEC